MANRALYKNRMKWVMGIFISISLLYIIKLFSLQILDDTWKDKANINALDTIRTQPPRGVIYDRYGEKLVDNEKSYELYVLPIKVGSFDTLELCRILNIDTADFNRRMDKAMRHGRRCVSVFMSRLSPQMDAYLREKSHKFKGFYLSPPIAIRKYHIQGAAHVLGYVTEVNKEDIAKDGYYVQRDNIGRSGIERSYEKELRGIKGVTIALRDPSGNIQGSYMDGQYDENAVPGQSLWCSIDKELQEYGEKLMEGKRGSIVAIEPQTGEILALVTSPAYDPSLLVGSEKGNNYMALLRDSVNKPLFNRALMAQYPPGSTFKLVNALVFQQAGAVNENTRFSCSHGFAYGNRKLGCHGHASPLDIAGSVQNSCNAWYCRGLIAMLDDRKHYKSTEEAYATWRKMVGKLGFGDKFGSDLPYELTGFIPTEAYYNKHYGKGRWKATTIISISIGQGEICATPIQLANLAALIANRGYYYTPHIVKEIGHKDSLNTKFTVKHNVGIERKYFAPVVLGMERAVSAGTARRASVPGIKVCAKTGTAQNPPYQDHSLLVCFAPAEQPKIAISVIVENGGFGATWAAPIASLMIEKYLKRTIERPEYEASIVGKSIYYAK